VLLPVPLDRIRIEYDREAPHYDRRWEGYLRLTTDILLPLREDWGSETLLDVGCGTGVLLGRIAQRWPGARLHGIDPSRGMLRRARLRLGADVNLVRGEATTLPFRDHTFSIVTSSSSLRYWPDPAAGVGEIARVLRPGGRLLLLDWCGDALRHRLLGHWLGATGRVAGHIHRCGELEGLLHAAGFSAKVECVRAGWYWRLVLVRATLS
jgi:ubiquinone/menaquinone biosynthesis C-methylase UbiE